MIPCLRHMGLLGLLVLAACGSTVTSPTATAPQTLLATAVDPTRTAAQTTPITAVDEAEPEIWLEEDFLDTGAPVAIVFYEANGPCIRYMVDIPQEACAKAGASLVMVSGLQTDKAGYLYTVVAGRILDNSIVTVVVEMDGNESLPVLVNKGGVFVILPGKVTLRNAVPINQFGNTVGEIFRFN
jgi:hypothetical protein